MERRNPRHLDTHGLRCVHGGLTFNFFVRGYPCFGLLRDVSPNFRRGSEMLDREPQAVATTRPEPTTERLLTMNELKAETRYSRPSIYRLIRDAGFPRPLKMAPGGRVLFRESEVRQWLADRPRAL